jgi:hypothetical protein
MITAEEAGKAIDVVAHRLLAAEIVQDDGYAVLHRIASEFKVLKKAYEWKFEVDRGAPIRFHRTRAHLKVCALNHAMGHRKRTRPPCLAAGRSSCSASHIS